MRHTTITLAPGESAELDLGPCTCPAGKVCPDGDPFAPLCPRRAATDRFLVMRGTADGQRWVRKLLGEVGVVVWTPDRAKAHRFLDRTAATYVQRCIVVHDGGSAAVVPESADDYGAVAQ